MQELNQLHFELRRLFNNIRQIQAMTLTEEFRETFEGTDDRTRYLFQDAALKGHIDACWLIYERAQAKLSLEKASQKILWEICKSLGIKNYTKMSKAAIIAAIRERQKENDKGQDNPSPRS